MLTIAELPPAVADKIVVGDEPDACWIWSGGRSDRGYGMSWSPEVGGMVLAHRRVFELLVAPIEADDQLDHLCHDPDECRAVDACPHRACVNPAHLEPVTQAENIRRARRSSCKRGHPWSPENTYIRPDTGTRQCRACGRERRR